MYKDPATMAHLLRPVPLLLRCGLTFRLLAALLLVTLANLKVHSSVVCQPSRPAQPLDEWHHMLDYPCDSSLLQKCVFMLPHLPVVLRPLLRINVDNFLMFTHFHLLITLGLVLVIVHPSICRADSRTRMFWLTAGVTLPRFLLAGWLVLHPDTRVKPEALPVNYAAPLMHLLMSLYLPVCWQSQLVVSGVNGVSAFCVNSALAATGNWSKDKGAVAYSFYSLAWYCTAPLFAWVMAGGLSGGGRPGKAPTQKYGSSVISAGTLNRETVKPLSASSTAVAKLLASGGARAQYIRSSGVRKQVLYAKIPYAEPEQMPADFTARLNASAAAHGLILTNVAVRRGCIELLLEFADDELGIGSNDCSPTCIDAQARGVLLAQSIISALNLPAPPGAQIRVSLEQPTGSLYMALAAVPGTSQLQPLPLLDTRAAGSNAPATAIPEILSVTPVCLTAPLSGAPLQLQLAVCLPPDALLQATANGSAGGWTLVATQHDRFLTVESCVPESPSSALTATSHALSRMPSNASLFSAVVCGFQGECDTVRLALLSPDSRMSRSKHVLVLPAELHAMCAELQALPQHLAESAAESASLEDCTGGLDVDMLLHDLGLYLLYVASWRQHHDPCTATASFHTASTPEELATVAPARHLDPKLVPVMQGLRQDCLEAAVENGLVETARQLLTQPELPPADLAAAGLCAPAATAAASCQRRGMTLLHRAVKSRSFAMVQMVHAAVGGNWGDMDADRLTPLHIAAVIPDGGIMACHILMSYAEAHAVWTRGRDIPSPAQLAAHLGAVVDLGVIAAGHKAKHKAQAGWLRRVGSWWAGLHLLSSFPDPATELRYQQHVAASSFRMHLVLLLVQLAVAATYTARIIATREYQALFATWLYHGGSIVAMAVALHSKRAYLAHRQGLWMLVAVCHLSTKVFGLLGLLPWMAELQQHRLLTLTAAFAELAMSLPTHQVPLWLPLSFEALDLPFSVMAYSDAITNPAAGPWAGRLPIAAFALVKSGLLATMLLVFDKHARARFVCSTAGKAE